MRAVLMLIFLTTTTPLAQAQWTIKTPTTADLRGIDNVGKGIAWASGTNGTVLRTEDAGYLWQRCTIPPGAEHLDFRGIQAFDANTAIVMSSGPGDQSRLYKTTDGCQTWTLLFTNPDKVGFWDAISIQHASIPSLRRGAPGYILGDPVNGRFVIFETNNGGETWTRWESDSSRHPAVAEKNEAVFAASNSALLYPANGENFAFVTGGGSVSRLLTAIPDNPWDYPRIRKFRTLRLSLQRSESSGAFSLARKPADGYGRFFVIVGGDYKSPNTEGYSVTVDGADTLFPHQHQATTPPHGYRSAVAYDSKTKTWITVGPNGTDISTDDGRNWRPLHPTNNDAPDADQHWNALSLPYAVGPHGRIGILNPSALQPSKP